MMLNAVRAGSELVNLLPSHTARWWPLVEDVFSSEKCTALRSALLAACQCQGEFRSISIDGTFRICLSILGQKSFNLARSERNDAAVPEDESLRRVITVRGRTGAVVSMFASYGEGAPEIQKGLQNTLPEEALRQIEFVATDAPSKRLYATLKEILPNLQALCLDPIHLAMHYESASARHRTAGSATLRRGLAKFSVKSSSPRQREERNWGDFHCGEEVVLTAREKTYRQQILDGGMSKSKGQRILGSLDGGSPWQTRMQFIEFLAAVSAVYRSEVTRKTESDKTVAELLHQAAAADRVEWVFNNLRLRQVFSRADNILLPVGTTSNESLHAELNGWFRQTQGIHPTTLKMKLDILTLSKLLAHNTALYSPTARQMLSGHILARRIGNGLWKPEEWKSWATHEKKANLPMDRARQKEAQRLKGFIAKRPAAIRKRPATCKHKTPFNLTRSKGIRRAGVHSRPS